MRFQTLFIVLISLSFFSCKDDVMPKPAAYLRLDYPESKYKTLDHNCPYSFEINTNSVLKNQKGCDFEINYPKMKATLYITYKPVHNNIKDLLRDAQKLTYEHVIKADDIVEQPFVNTDQKVYGMFYSVNGNAATNAQFYATDSTKHFLECSVYFYAKPNFDSIYPATSFIKNDMRKLMETLRWK